MKRTRNEEWKRLLLKKNQTADIIDERDLEMKRFDLFLNLLIDVRL